MCHKSPTLAMRTCKICLKTDILNDMLSFFEHPDLILDLHYLSNIAIVELNGDEAKICRRCAQKCKHAAEFKRLCIESDMKSKQNSDERFIWFESLQKLRNSESAEPTVESMHVCQEENNNNSKLEEIATEINNLIAEMDSYENRKEVTKDCPEQNKQLIDFIEFLNYDQLKELTDMLDSDIFKN